MGISGATTPVARVSRTTGIALIAALAIAVYLVSRYVLDIPVSNVVGF
jgi:hypothetical protein